MEHTYYYYYSNYDIDKYIIIYSHSLLHYIFYNGLKNKTQRSEAKKYYSKQNDDI